VFTVCMFMGWYVLFDCVCMYVCVFVCMDSVKCWLLPHYPCSFTTL